MFMIAVYHKDGERVRDPFAGPDGLLDAMEAARGAALEAGPGHHADLIADTGGGGQKCLISFEHTEDGEIAEKK